MTPYQGFPFQRLMQIPSSEISLEIMIVPNIFTEEAAYHFHYPNSQIEFSNPNFGLGTIVGISHDLPSGYD